MASAEHKVILFSVCFLLFFGYMIQSMPVDMVENQSTTFSDVPVYVEPPTYFDVGSLSRSEIISQDYANVSYPEGGHNFYLTYQDTNDTQINLVWVVPDELAFTHVHWLFYIIPLQKQMNPYPLYNATVLGSIEEGETAEFWLRCVDGDIPEVYLGISFDNDTYADLGEAWDDGELSIYVAFLSNATFTGGNAWALVGSLLTFSAPNIHPIVNFFIAVPVWVSIIISILYVLEKILPF